MPAGENSKQGSVEAGVAGCDLACHSRAVAKRLYVANVPYSFSDAHLRAAFLPHGMVEAATIVIDKVTGRSRGVAFVEMATPEGAVNAIAAMNGFVLDGRPLTVSLALQRTRRPARPGS